MTNWHRRGAVYVTLVALSSLLACGSSGNDDRTVTLYTCVSDTTIGPVIDAFEESHSGTKVKLYRAPTGDLNARVAADVRSGGLRADVIWACDPLTMQGYVDQQLVGGWTPSSPIDDGYRTEDYVGVALLYVVAITGDGVRPPQAWSDLADDTYSAGVAVPDPALAASALGALGYFASAPGYGMGFYKNLADHGAKQVSTPDDVVAGVAEGRYAAGITIANAAYAASQAGSPIHVTWPEPGAIAIYGPIALAADPSSTADAKAFISFVSSERGQQVIGDAGSYPTLEGVSGPTKPADAAVVVPDWPRIAGSREELLTEYHQNFGG